MDYAERSRVTEADDDQRGRTETPRVERVMLSLGQQIRALRRNAGMTLEDLSQRSDLSTGMLSQVERGLGNPSFASLVRIAHALNISVAQIMVGDSSRSRVVRANERRRLDPHPTSNGDEAVFELLTPSLDQQLEVVWVEIPPGESTEDTPYSHAGEEFGLVLDGLQEVHVGDEVYLLNPGDAISYPSTIPHWYRNAGAETVKAVWVITPPSF